MQSGSFNSGKGRRLGKLALACVAGIAATTARQTSAAERNWLPSNGAFGLGFFWAEGVAPGPSDNALFNTGATAYAVGFSLGDATTNQLSVLDAHPQFALGGHTYTVLDSTFVGYNAGELGQLDLVGTGTLNGAYMTLGQFARSEGRVTLNSSALLKASTLNIGSSGDGSVTVNPGTRLEAGFLDVGGAAGATGSLSVSGSNATADAGLVFIGGGGAGVASVSSGAVVTSGTGANQATTLGNEATGDGLLSVTGAGTQWNTRLMQIGLNGRGELDVDNGARVNAGVLFMGGDAAARGVVILRGSGSTLTLTNAAKGNGYAQVNIETGATITLNGGATGKYQIPNTNLNGGTLSVTNLATPINFNSGTLQVTGANGLAIGAAVVTGQSAVNADFAVPTAGTLQVTGQLNVAAGRRLSVNGAGTIEAGALASDVSANAGTIDVLRGTLLIHNALVNQSGASVTAVGTDSITFQSGLQNSGAVNLTDVSVTGAVTNAAPGKIFVADNATFANKVINNGLIAGGGSLAFNGGLTNNGTITVTGGQTVTPAAPSPSLIVAGGIDGTGALTVGAGAAADTAYVSQQSLHVTDGGIVRMRNSTGTPTVSVVKSLQLDAGGSVDIANNALVVDYTAGSSPLASVRSAIVAQAITSSALTSSKAIGYAEAGDVLLFANGATSDTFLGSTADKTSVLVRYTLTGDANLDGSVDFLDLARLAQNYNMTSGTRTWSAGDFNNDGNVDFLDLARLAQNYNTALSGAAVAGAPAGFTQDLARAFASVPEPSAVFFSLVLAGGTMLRRRQRKNRHCR
jgi:T5SS/PEP-CTERM-associated repeat protein